MCMRSNYVRPYQHWNWAGDEIIHETIIPASRTIPGIGLNKYDIDIRQFLSAKGNRVIGRELEKLLGRLESKEQARFAARSGGSFDFRALKVLEHVASLDYRSLRRNHDPWLFPEETLAGRGGDCEDLAFLLAALLDVSGISSYCIRVALGLVVDHSGPTPATDVRHHAWVVYKSESGAWKILEPLARGTRARRELREEKSSKLLDEIPLPDVEYIPYFVFNQDHLWRVRVPPSDGASGGFLEYLEARHFWKDFDPLFFPQIHDSIHEEALVGMSHEQLEKISFVNLFVDGNVAGYDPRDHFDFGYIEPSWERVKRRLETQDLIEFTYATHAIADFYAHTLYADFGGRNVDGSLMIHDPDNPGLPANISYDFGQYDLPGCPHAKHEAERYWSGKLISGQWWRSGKIPFWHFPEELEMDSEFRWRRCLPDHDAIAVDGPTPFDGHVHYGPDEYREQFRLRREAAVKHIRAAFQLYPPLG